MVSTDARLFERMLVDVIAARTMLTSERFELFL
jgi:hypothetical protein